MERVLITGASGLLGSALISTALGRGYTVFALSHQSSVAVPRVVNLQGDLTQISAIRSLLDKHQPQILIHCAALTNVDVCEKHPDQARALNVTATATLAEWAARQQCYCVYISTDSVFDGKRGDYIETDIPHPLNIYAQTKWEGEEALRRSTPQHLIARTNFYGWGGGSRLSLAEWLLREMLQKKEITTFKDVRFNALYANDLARLLLDAIKLRLTGTFNFASGDACSKHEFALLISRLFQLPACLKPISVDEFPFPAKRPKDTTLVTNKLSQSLKRQMPLMADGIRAFKADRTKRTERP